MVLIGVSPLNLSSGIASEVLRTILPCRLFEFAKSLILALSILISFPIEFAASDIIRFKLVD